MKVLDNKYDGNVDKFNEALKKINDFAEGWYTNVYDFYYINEKLDVSLFEFTIEQILSFLDRNELSEQQVDYCRTVFRTAGYFIDVCCNRDDHRWVTYKKIFPTMIYEKNTKNKFTYLMAAAMLNDKELHYPDLFQNYLELCKNHILFNKKLSDVMTEAIRHFLYFKNCSYFTDDKIDELTKRIDFFCAFSDWSKY